MLNTIGILKISYQKMYQISSEICQDTNALGIWNTEKKFLQSEQYFCNLVKCKSFTWDSEAKITHSFKASFKTTDVVFSTIMNQSID